MKEKGDSASRCNLMWVISPQDGVISPMGAGQGGVKISLRTRFISELQDVLGISPVYV